MMPCVHTGHVREFGTILTQLQGDRLPQWIKAVRADDLPGLHTFVTASNAISPPSPRA